ncbi:glutathione S-transferase [Pseudoroseomonas ludipueritiae]|uniref:Glutathione S-transferase n=1 Tax=Pseudoroseomonas ludipueritiae TaxID=198093 RepID=A0ABR7REJ8_9PROT|nr:glutathione S-transferase [Pseudoroseomonas ludipueritiae]MBC9180078.1 glutathione S-transferase [Pseudoroseomonas ludipueritiae]
MQLFYSATSPYVRKVMVCALLRGLDDRIERVNTNPHLSPPELLAQNPLSKVPCLVTVEGLPVYDSRVICEYLDGLGTAHPLFPEPGPERTGALVMQALGDGIMDAAVARRMQQPLPQDEGRRDFSGRARAAVARALEVLEAAPPQGLRDIGAVAVACALGYLDLRFADEPWREAHPKLAAWFAEVSQHAALTGTTPA